MLGTVSSISVIDIKHQNLTSMDEMVLVISHILQIMATLYDRDALATII